MIVFTFKDNNGIEHEGAECEFCQLKILYTETDKKKYLVEEHFRFCKKRRLSKLSNLDVLVMTPKGIKYDKQPGGC